MEPGASVETIRDYDALLFPTRFPGEGIPGTVIDAMAAGLPVIAARWRYYGEMLADGVTGLSYDQDRPEQLEDALREFLALDADTVSSMRRAMHQRARAYMPQAVADQVQAALTGPRPRDEADRAARLSGRTCKGAPGDRIMLVAHDLEVGGAETTVLHLARSLHDDGSAVLVVGLGKDGTKVCQRLGASGIEVVALDKHPGPDLKTVMRLRRTVVNFAPSIIHTHQPVLPYVLSAVALTGQRPRIVHTLHSVAEHETRQPAVRLINRWAFNHGVTPVALSEQIRQSAARMYHLDPARVPVVPNGIDLEAHRDQRPERDRGPHQPVRLLCVARLAPVKNHDLLLRTVAEMTAQGRSVRLALVGDGPERGRLEHVARALRIQDLVTFAGEVDDTVAYYRQADVLVLTSSHEGLPLTIVEAMASGLPVVATSVGGVPSIVRDGVNGALVDGEAGPQAVAAAIERVWRDPQRYKHLSLGALTTSSAYSARAMTEAYRGVYR